MFYGNEELRFLKVLFQHLPGWLEEHHENLSQDCWPPYENQIEDLLNMKQD
jgi:hypothetical protein